MKSRVWSLRRNCVVLVAVIGLCFPLDAFAETAAYLDTSLSQTQRIHDLVERLTLEEKVSQLMYESPAIPRLDIPAYNWWNECLHGVARGGKATVFPQTIGLGATFDKDLMTRIGKAVSDEARAIHHAAIKRGIRKQYGGLTFWTPNINIYRDPRWGRGMETYGEDPNLTSQLAGAYAMALQGDHPEYLKVAACAKHYAVHSGPEKDRHVFDAMTNDKDLHETYLPAFKALVDQGIEAVMCAFNRTNGEACCGSKTLLGKILLEDWHFKGHIVTDCGALGDFHEGHKITENKVQSAVLALKSGVNLNCGTVFPALLEAVEQKLVTEAEIDKALSILLRTRFKLGMFDPLEKNPYARISTDVIHCRAHQALALEAAEKSMVLLKNNGVLPLSKDIASLFVIGPSATNTDVLMGNYFGVSEHMVTFLEGIAAQLDPGTMIQYQHGFLLDRDNVNPIDWTTGNAKMADAIIVCMGLSPLLEGEEGESIASPTKGDRFDLNLPENQIAFLRKLRKKCKNPIVVVLTGGSPVTCPEVHELADAVLYAWYPGEQGGDAVGNVLFGAVSPSGRLPVTFPKSVDQLPDYTNYSMAERTYRYMTKEPLYPFGFGLSYTCFDYANLRFNQKTARRGQAINVQVDVRNTGEVAADEVIQLYITCENKEEPTSLQTLKDFQRVHLKPGQQQTLCFTITPNMMKQVDEAGNSRIKPGLFRVTIGGACPIARSEQLGAAKPVAGYFKVN